MAKKKSLYNEVNAPNYAGGVNAGERWWECEDDDVWKIVFSTVEDIDSRQVDRRVNWNTFRTIFENKGTPVNSDGRLPLIWADGRLTLNVIRSCINTVSAKISQEKPRAFFLTSAADFGMQQKAEKLTRYMDGVFTATRQYEVSQDVFTDCCVYGTGAMRHYVDGERPGDGDDFEDDRSVKSERVLIQELTIDDREAVYGKPLQIHQKRLVSKDILCAQYPDHEDAIRQAPSYIGENSTHSNGMGMGNDGNMVEVIESWHLRSGKRVGDGRHCLSLKAENGTLFCEEYEKDYFPFTFLHWSRPLSGFWGIGLAEELMGVQKEINRLLRDIHLAQRNAVPTIFIEKNSGVNPDDIDNSPHGRIIQYKTTPPMFNTPTAMNGEMYNQLDRLYSKAFELAGVSQLSAGGKKPAGLDAAVAIREVQDIETGRFVLQGQRYDQAHVDIARIFVDMSKDIFADNPSLKVKTRSKYGKKFIATVPWSEVDMQEDQYEMDIFPVSQLPRTPGARMQTITELMDRQDENGKPLISGAMALQLLNFPDLEEFSDLKTAGLNVIRMHIDKMLSGGEFIAPLPFMDLQTAVELAQMNILLAMLNEVPELAIENLQKYMTACMDLMPTDSSAAPPEEAPPPGPPGAPPMDPSMMPPMGGPPGAPPMPPPPMGPPPMGP